VELGVWPSFADYLIAVADALHENRGVEYADGHQDTKVPCLVDRALVWEGPAYPCDLDWTRFAQPCGRNLTACSGRRPGQSTVFAVLEPGLLMKNPYSSSSRICAERT
jgi:hypothetical protein